MFYLALLVGLVLLTALYFSTKWEEKQYEDIEHVIDETDEETEKQETDEVLEEPGKLWEGTINGVDVKISKGWQREIFVVVKQGFPFEARVEVTNFLRSMTRFFKEMTTPRMSVHSSEADGRLLAYSTDPDPTKRLLMAWSKPDIIDILQGVHHVEFSEDEFTVMFYHPDIDLEEITEKAKKVIELFQAIPGELPTEPSDTTSPGKAESNNTDMSNA